MQFNLEQRLSLSLWRKLCAAWHRKRLTPAAWRTISMVGDSVLLFSLLAFVSARAPGHYFDWSIWRYKLGAWDAQIVWSLLVFSGWRGAARVTEAYEPCHIAGRLSGPLCSLSALVLMAIVWAFLTCLLITSEPASMQVVFVFLTLTLPAFGIWRFLLAELIHVPRLRPQAVIVGVNAAGKSIAEELRRSEQYATVVLGYIDTIADESAYAEGVSVLGGVHALRHLAQSGMVDLIIMAIDYGDDPGLFQDILELAQPGLTILPMTTVYERASGKVPVQCVGNQWCVALPTEIMRSSLYIFWRFLSDKIFGLVGTVLVLLIFPVLAALIYLDSPGPIFYTQERLGRNGRTFAIYKFRSMCIDAEQAGHAVWAARCDARVTQIGRFLRATHLDELPQAFNVLRGEMSLIGPRPERQEFASNLEKMIPFYRCRLSVKPGLTGWAQVRCSYTRTDQEALEKLQYDLYYVKHQSFMLDMLIILKTVGEVLLRRGS